MAVISDIEIRLRADIARLQQDMDRARQSVTSTMDRITSVAKGAMGALAAIGGVAMFAGFIKSAIDATDAVSDISQRTGVAIKDIAGLQLWFQIGGAEAGEFESSMIKLAKAVASNSKGFDRIGVSTRESNGALRSSVDVLRDSADAFAKMQDGTAKTALAVELFGKSGATLIPILNSGSDGLREMTEMADKLGLTFDQKVVDQAGEFNDTLDFLGLAAQGVGRQVAAQLLPTLTSLAGSFLNFITKSDAVRKSCDAIAFGFKTLYTFGVSVGTMFTTLGNVIAGSLALITTNLSTLALGLKQAIEGDYSKAWQTLSSGGAAAGAIVKATFNDIKTDMSAAAVSIGEVWTGTGGDTLEALVKMQQQGKHVSEEERKELEKRAAAWAQLKATLEDARDASARQAAGLEPLNAAEQRSLELTRDLERGKVVLTKAQVVQAKAIIEEDRANIAAVKSQDALKESLKRLDEQEKELLKTRQDVIEKAREEAEANEKLVQTFGMTEAAIAALEVARLKEQLAQRSNVGLTLDEIEHLEKLIELKERSTKAVGDKQALEEQKQFWADIDKTAHDTFVSIADGGKNAAQRLKETFKNTFFDWLYQQTIKKWIVNVQATGTMSGTGAATSWFDAGKTMLEGFSKNLSTSIGGVISKLGSAFGSKAATSFGSNISSSASAGGIAGAIVAGMMANNKFYDEGWRIDGQVGDIISSQLKSMFKGNGFASITAIMTASMASFEKILSGIGVNGKLASMLSGSAVFARAFGRKAPSIEAEGIRGSITSGGFTGEAFANILEKGGWFRSDKRYTKGAALGAEQESAFDTTITGIADSIRAFSQILGAETSAIDGYSKQVNITLTKDEAENQKLIEAMFSGIGDELAQRVLPNIEMFTQQGEAASATLQRLAVNFVSVDGILQAMGTDSITAFKAVGLASLEARERLIKLAGGVDALASQTAFFTQNFLSEAEQITIIQKPLNEQLAALGYAGITSADQFKVAVQSLIQSGAAATEEGAKKLAGLLALGPQFKTVSDYLQELSDSAKAAADAAAAEQAANLAQEVAEREAAAFAKSQLIAEQRMQLQEELDSLTLSEIELLAMQREAYDPSVRAIFDHIQAVKAEKAAVQEAAVAIQAAAASAAAAMQSLGGAVSDAMTNAKRSAEAIRDFADSLKQGALSALDADGRYRAAREAYEKSKPGDTNAAQDFLQASRDRGADDFYYNLDYATVQAKLSKDAARLDAYANSLPAFYASLSQPATVLPSATPQPYISATSQAAIDASNKILEERLNVIANKMTQLADQFDSASDGGQGLKQLA